MTRTILECKDLKKHFSVRGGVFFREQAKVFALDGVSFTIDENQTLGLVGESGCGKSTVGKTLLRLHKPTAGRVLFRGEDLSTISGERLLALRREIQIIFQDPFESLNPRDTVAKILEEPYLIHHIGNREERMQWIRELLDKVGLPKNALYRYPHEFSGGQRQRIGIARAIALKPKLIICDEPVSALDVSIQSQVINLLLDLQVEMGLSLLFIAHDLAVVKHVSDRIAVMYLGKIVEMADARNLYENPMHPYTQALIEAIPTPDPKAKKKLTPLQGDVPSPINPPGGCHFHTRCRYAKAICTNTPPELKSHGNNHVVSCHFAGELTPSRL